jgi:hypothetical protein
MLSPVTVQNQNGHFSVSNAKKGATFLSCVLHKISSLYAPSEIASQFPPPLRSNNYHLFDSGLKIIRFIVEFTPNVDIS